MKPSVSDLKQRDNEMRYHESLTLMMEINTDEDGGRMKSFGGDGVQH